MNELNLPVGYRFDPKDGEMIVYLRCKIFNRELPSNVISITQKDPYSQTPEDLPLIECEYFKMNEWFFFAERPSCDVEVENLMTADGFYSCTSGDVLILEESDIVGFKRKYNFFRGTPPKQTQWVIYEYRLNPDAFQSNELDDLTRHKISGFVACKLVWERLKKSSGGSNQPTA